MTAGPESDAMERYADYDKFALAYNESWSDFVYYALPKLKQLALDQARPGCAILDLCCGTGHLAKLLLAEGYDVSGVDGSEEMLRFARQNAPAASFTCADARSFSLPSRYDIVFSTYDSLNHVLKLEQLEQVFQRVYAHLLPGGLFVFDMNLEAAYPARWVGAHNTTSGLAVTDMYGTYDDEDRIAGARLTVFTRCEDDMRRWQRQDVFLMQRAYTVEELRSALTQAGFAQIEAFDAERDLKMRYQVGRVFVRARRPAGSSPEAPG